MNTSDGHFAWYELETSNVAAAATFYQEVVGWDVADAGHPDMQYTLLKVRDHAIAGIMDIPAKATMHPHWVSFITCSDVDASVAEIVKEGGSLHRGPSDVAGVGRFAVVSDPQSVGFILFKPNGNASRLPSGTPGTAGWHELLTTDHKVALAFYTKHFGWGEGAGIDMGPMGTYQIFTQDGADLGGMMDKPKEVPSGYWMVYFNVADVRDAAGRVTKAGGQILFGPSPVPGGSMVLQCKDPQGAMFALVSRAS